MGEGRPRVAGGDATGGEGTGDLRSDSIFVTNATEIAADDREAQNRVERTTRRGWPGRAACTGRRTRPISPRCSSTTRWPSVPALSCIAGFLADKAKTSPLQATPPTGLRHLWITMTVAGA